MFIPAMHKSKLTRFGFSVYDKDGRIAYYFAAVRAGDIIFSRRLILIK